MPGQLPSRLFQQTLKRDALLREPPLQSSSTDVELSCMLSSSKNRHDLHTPRVRSPGCSYRFAFRVRHAVVACPDALLQIFRRKAQQRGASHGLLQMARQFLFSNPCS
jgi:hypothetical protein